MSDSEAIDRIDDGRAWDEFCERLKQTGHQILEAAPDDSFDRAEGLRYLARLTRNFLGNALADPQPRRYALGHAISPKIGLDNPDYVYCGASLDAHERRLSALDSDSNDRAAYEATIASQQATIANLSTQCGPCQCAPAPPPTPTAMKLSAGRYHNCALVAAPTGNVTMCWGRNNVS